VNMDRLQFLQHSRRMALSRWGLMGAKRKLLSVYDRHANPLAWPGYSLRRLFSGSRIKNIKHRKTYRLQTKVI